MKYLMMIFLGSFVSLSAKEYRIDQKNKKFSRDEITIKAGDKIRFRNSDPFFHNVYSLSPLKIFDLGSYSIGKSKTVKFNKPGVVEVNCAIHPNMKLKVRVKK
ncbi:MAG: plastocyanin/azurin family copper-binding protein [Spirochaetota bacterium]